MEELIQYAGYAEYKKTLDAELQRAAEGFVRIGYLLKLARDTEILKGSGYASVIEFAQAEYNIDKTQVSRFIKINDRFAEGGYSEHLKEQYRGLGYAKLAIMLQLPDEVNEEITPSFSKAEIQAIKDEADAERKISDIEVLLEGEDHDQAALDDNLHRAVHQMGRDNPELYVMLHDMVKKSPPSEEKWIDGLHDILAPAGESIYSVRIRGTGRLMLSVKETDKDVTLTNIRTGEKEAYSWQDVLHAVQQIMDPEQEAEEAWKTAYGEEYPKQEVAPVQPEPEKKKPVPKKQEKVTKAKVEKKETVKAQVIREEEESEEKTGQPEEEKQDDKEEVAGQQDEKEEENLDDEAADETIYRLKEDAGTYLKEVAEALDANEYFRARTRTKHLLETLNEIVEELDQKPLPGQERLPVEE